MSLVQRLGIAYPIIQAPMAGTATPAMAAAVSNAGGLGSIGVGPVNAEQARTMIRQIREKTSKPFNVNLFTHQDAKADLEKEKAWIEHLRPEYEKFGATPPTSLKGYPSFLSDKAMLEVILDEKPPVVSFHFGLPSAEVIKALKANGAVLFSTATNLQEARAAEAAGIDAIVAQGIEAGGHRGMFDPDAPDDQLGTFALTRLLVKHSKLPVIAAGGIMDGAGVRAVLDLGAAAAQLGTAFISCPESNAPQAHKDALIGEPGQHTRLVSVVSGRPARTVASRWTEIADQATGSTAAYPDAYEAGKQLHALASAKGDNSYGAFWAGQGAPLARTMPAAQMMETLVKEAKLVPIAQL